MFYEHSLVHAIRHLAQIAYYIEMSMEHAQLIRTLAQEVISLFYLLHPVSDLSITRLAHRAAARMHTRHSRGTLRI